MKDHWPKDQLFMVVFHVSIVLVGLTVAAVAPAVLRFLGD